MGVEAQLLIELDALNIHLLISIVVTGSPPKVEGKI